jgi:hypothetical protein
MKRALFVLFALGSFSFVFFTSLQGESRSDGIQNVRCPKSGCAGNIIGSGTRVLGGREYECSNGHKVVIKDARP